MGSVVLLLSFSNVLFANKFGRASDFRDDLAFSYPDDISWLTDVC